MMARPALLLLSVVVAHAAEQQRPKVVFFLVDDLGQRAVWVPHPSLRLLRGSITMGGIPPRDMLAVLLLHCAEGLRGCSRAGPCLPAALPALGLLLIAARSVLQVGIGGYAPQLFDGVLAFRAPCAPSVQRPLACE